tara:strand:- start:438 stop:668 length:231 start_codon:yes stop_codon:yes gene_type:complete
MKNTQRYQYRKIINSLIEQRKLQKLSQEKVALTVGTDTKLFGQWERMEVEPRLFNLLCWCEALNVFLTICCDDDEF